ncbi:S24 family peptidase [Hydrogenimonas urashimensis]|uniref:S24 family peptidase n=1 Tax=Hydrogenimonas urashimensis TaxID=2740515 RepID=UPI00191654F8|nr:S24 family peptidase [Hydrogenimonas urashimensis]
MTEIGKRFHEAMTKVYGTDRYGNIIANEYGISPQAVSKFKKAKKLTDNMKRIAAEKGIYLPWLEYGAGDMFGNKQLSSAPSNTVSIPFYPDIYASAGGGAYNYDTAPKKVPVSIEFITEILGLPSYEGLHLITAVGDSMSPTIESGDRLYVLNYEQDGGQLRDGGIYVIQTPMGVLVKRVYIKPADKVIVLHSDNSNVGDERITGDELDDCIIVGRVVGGVRKY